MKTGQLARGRQAHGRAGNGHVSRVSEHADGGEPRASARNVPRPEALPALGSEGVHVRTQSPAQGATSESPGKRHRGWRVLSRTYGRNLRPPCFAPKTFPGEIRTGSEMGKNTHEANSRAEGHEGKTSSAEAAGGRFMGERERETRARGGHPDTPSSRASLRQEARSGAPVPWKRRSSVKPTASRGFQNKLKTLGVRVVNQQYVCSIQRLNSHPLHPIK